MAEPFLGLFAVLRIGEPPGISLIFPKDSHLFLLESCPQEESHIFVDRN